MEGSPSNFSLLHQASSTVAGGLLPFVLLECSVVATCRKQVVSLILPGNYPTTRFACVAVPSPTTIRRKSTIESDIYSQKIGIE